MTAPDGMQGYAMDDVGDVLPIIRRSEAADLVTVANCVYCSVTTHGLCAGHRAGQLAEARVLARVAWPGERRENRESWTPRIIAEPELRRQTYEQALEKLDFQRRMVEAAYRALEGQQ